MLLRKRSLFFVPTYPPCTARPFRFSSSPLPRVLLTASKHALRQSARRTYATHHASSNNASGQGIPIGKIPLGSGKSGSAKGIAIRDDITKSWKELSFPQKVVRTGAQTTNFAVIIVGVGVLGVVIYYLVVAVFLPTSETSIFSKAFERVRNDEQIKRLIGEKMKAYGEDSNSRWARNRRIASVHRLDPQNVDHLFMKFYVEGENGKATVRLEMTKGEHDHQYKYRYLFVEFDPLPGFQPKRIYLERVPDPKKPPSSSGSAASQGESKKGFLGIKWGFESGDPRR